MRTHTPTQQRCHDKQREVCQIVGKSNSVTSNSRANVRMRKFDRLCFGWNLELLCNLRLIQYYIHASDTLSTMQAMHVRWGFSSKQTTNKQTNKQTSKSMPRGGCCHEGMLLYKPLLLGHYLGSSPIISTVTASVAWLT